LLCEVSVYDHEAQRWVVFRPFERARDVAADPLLQSVIDAGHDDVRLLIHLTGSIDECDTSLEERPEAESPL
jgi:hypothetical protein